MKENLHDIDKLFKAALEDMEETPGEDVWNNIDQHLDKHTVVSISKKYVQLKRVAIALLILLVASGIYTITQWKSFNEQSKRNDVNNEEVKNNSNKNDGLVNSGNNKIDQSINSADDNNNNLVTTDYSNADTTANLEADVKKSVQENSADDAPSVSEIVSINKQENSTELTFEKQSVTQHGSTKVLTHQRKQTTAITNAIPEDADEKTLSNKPVLRDLIHSQDMVSLPTFYPELKSAGTAYASDKTITPVSKDLRIGMIQSRVAANAKKITRSSPFTATVFIAPGFTSNQIKHEKHGPRPGRGNNHDDNEIREGENHQLAVSTGLLVDYSLNKRWSVQSGVTYSNKSIRINPKTIYADADNNGNIKYLYNCSAGYLYLSPKTNVTSPAIGDSIQAFEATTRLQYLSIPLAVKYSRPYKKFDLFVTAGTAINILTSGKLVTEIEGGINKETSVSDKINGLKQSYFGGNLSIGAAYNISNKFAISVSPIYNFALSSSTKDAAVKSYPNNLSLAAGIRYRL